MTDDWLDQLRQLRDEDEAKQQQQEVLDLNILKKQKAAADLLRKGRVHELLRDIQKNLLGGQGMLDFLDRKGEYEQVVSLVWQGSISKARRPDPDDPEPMNYILVGVRKGALWVNGKKVPQASPQALKPLLLEACKKPGREK